MGDLGLELRGDTHEGFVGSTTIKVWPWRSSLQRMQRVTLTVLIGKLQESAARDQQEDSQDGTESTREPYLAPLSPECCPCSQRAFCHAGFWPQPRLGKPTVPEGKGSPRSTMSDAAV